MGFVTLEDPELLPTSPSVLIMSQQISLVQVSLGCWGCAGQSFTAQLQADFLLLQAPASSSCDSAARVTYTTDRVPLPPPGWRADGAAAGASGAHPGAVVNGVTYPA